MGLGLTDAVTEQFFEDEETEMLAAHGVQARFPAHIASTEKKVLRTLAAAYPQMFCAASLIPFVGETSRRIRDAFRVLEAQGFIESQEIPAPLRTEHESYFYRFRESEFDRATEFLWREELDAAASQQQ